MHVAVGEEVGALCRSPRGYGCSRDEPGCLEAELLACKCELHGVPCGLENLVWAPVRPLQLCEEYQSAAFSRTRDVRGSYAREMVELYGSPLRDRLYEVRASTLRECGA